VKLPSRWVPVIIVLFLWTLSTRGKITVSGDEPHYLIIAESLLADRDLDLANNYAQNDGRRFGADGLTSGAHARPNRAGALWSVHDIGVPVLFLRRTLRSPCSRDSAKREASSPFRSWASRSSP
jgi:hypothetical protein